MSDEEPTPIFEPGDVVYGVDPFDGAKQARPWLVLSNHEDRPFHGEQYIVVTLTTKSWMDGLLEIPDDDWIRGGTPEQSRIVPWGVQSLSSDDIAFWQGRLRQRLVDDAVASLVDEVQQ
ncbi:type II toxin-antitoxin system PemK/MazF family toxin [Halobacterium sp. KA-6]|uniref:type II toxin-antitoxin system PemK/MazF family toxin n=1 Tax=Halobacterium sp. KA-6 TaxID=2896368 RepID=UPI001E5F3C50|nr:type II toxin-antitoxin system PemK/MazF family toxin [Halobacterium sp. KA-6]MCD2202371.1 type II toxin-antitoxin system PemK/MazF family toxin [Halobacterium sp. KA-6]